MHAFRWIRDWWNVDPSRAALKRVRLLMRQHWPADSPAGAQWDCMWESMVKGGAVDSARAAQSEILVEDYAYPASSNLGELILANMKNGNDHADLLQRHGDVLWGRASTPQGDLSALRVLGHLQAEVSDWEDLLRTNTLGWEKYRELRFAGSLLVSLHPGSGKDVDGRYSEALERAIADFPHAPQLQLWRIALKFPDGKVPAVDVARLIQAEIRTFDLGSKSSWQVAALYHRLAKLVSAQRVDAEESIDVMTFVGEQWLLWQIGISIICVLASFHCLISKKVDYISMPFIGIGLYLLIFSPFIIPFIAIAQPNVRHYFMLSAGVWLVSLRLWRRAGELFFISPEFGIYRLHRAALGLDDFCAVGFSGARDQVLA